MKQDYVVHGQKISWDLDKEIGLYFDDTSDPNQLLDYRVSSIELIIKSANSRSLSEVLKEAASIKEIAENQLCHEDLKIFAHPRCIEGIENSKKIYSILLELFEN